MQLNYLKRIEGQYRFKLNSLYSCMIEKYKLTNEVLTDLFNTKFDQINFFEIINILKLDAH